jgi:pimeloyl-ACP methyl ester carboxylesterase
MKPPETRYARSGNVRIAYQVIGNGPIDLVFVPGFLSNLEVHWEDPDYSHLLQRLGAFTRLIQFDKRGTGLSDRVDNRDLPDLETGNVIIGMPRENTNRQLRVWAPHNWIRLGRGRLRRFQTMVA